MTKQITLKRMSTTPNGMNEPNDFSTYLLTGKTTVHIRSIRLCKRDSGICPNNRAIIQSASVHLGFVLLVALQHGIH